jgi:uncharacterized SAM-binding protein YcdF (DUF218 family)
MKRWNPSVLGSVRRFLGYLGLLWVGFTLGFLILAYLMAGDIYDYEDTVDITNLPRVDAIVCLGGGRGRITAAGDLWYRYWERARQVHSSIKVPKLYFSGMGRQVNWSLLSKQLKKPVLQQIRLDDVVIEKESSNTDANARWLADFAQERHWKKIVLLTSSYHMKRANFMFDHVLKTSENPIDVETYSVSQEPFALHQWRSDPNGIRVTLMEYLKWVYYRTIWRSL